MNIKEVWNVWRESTPADKDMQRAFERACTPKACHGVLIEFESANQKIAELENEIQVKHCKLHQALKLRDTSNERIVELEKESKWLIDFALGYTNVDFIIESLESLKESK